MIRADYFTNAKPDFSAVRTAGTAFGHYDDGFSTHIDPGRSRQKATVAAAAASRDTQTAGFFWH
jgi:hypothetical protein